MYHQPDFSYVSHSQANGSRAAIQQQTLASYQGLNPRRTRSLTTRDKQVYSIDQLVCNRSIFKTEHVLFHADVKTQIKNRQDHKNQIRLKPPTS